MFYGENSGVLIDISHFIFKNKCTATINRVFSLIIQIDYVLRLFPYIKKPLLKTFISDPLIISLYHSSCVV